MDDGLIEFAMARGRGGEWRSALGVREGLGRCVKG